MIIINTTIILIYTFTFQFTAVLWDKQPISRDQIKSCIIANLMSNVVYILFKFCILYHDSIQNNKFLFTVSRMCNYNSLSALISKVTLDWSLVQFDSERTILFTEAVYILLVSKPDTMKRLLLKIEILPGRTATPSMIIE